MKLLGGNDVNELIHSLWIFREFFKENLPETIRYMGFKVSDVTEIDMLFQYSEILFC